MVVVRIAGCCARQHRRHVPNPIIGLLHKQKTMLINQAVQSRRLYIDSKPHVDRLKG
jgi:hypothetical protein